MALGGKEVILYHSQLMPLWTLKPFSMYRIFWTPISETGGGKCND